MPAVALANVKRFGRCFMGYKDALFCSSMDVRKLPALALAALAVLLLTLSWLGGLASLLIFPAFVVIFLLMDKVQGRKWLWLYAVYALWNGTTTYWIANAHPLGVIATVGINGALMALAFWMGYRSLHMFGRFRFFQKHPILAHLPFWATWIAFEKLHEHWGLSFPWLHLGNTFYDLPSLMQWYSITGVSGGSLWVLTVSSLWYEYVQGRGSRRALTIVGAGPILLSLVLWFTYASNSKNTIEVAAVQPNIDAYDEKWSLPEREQIEKGAQMLGGVLGQRKVDLVVLPETFLPKAREEGTFGRSAEDQFFLRSMANYADAVLVGATTYTLESEPTIYNRPMGNRYYTIYNTALFQDLNAPASVPSIYHKGKLVVGGETMPFVRYLKPLLGDWAVELGGTSGTLGVSTERSVFEKEELKLAPIICWENEFSDYTVDYSRLGANLLAVITNDGWWGDTPGHIQHLKFSGIRAIEHRKYVVRSANTGVSAIISDRGEVLQQLGWEKSGALVATVPLNEGATFYVKAGDFIGKGAVVIFAINVVLLLLSRFFRITVG